MQSAPRDRYGWEQTRPVAIPERSLTQVGENARVPTYTVNKDAVRHAKELIDARQFVLRSRWQDRQPRAREQNTFLKTHAWEEYAVCTGWV